MDLLFKRYASPFILIDKMISACAFSDFIKSLYKTVEDEQLWDYYLHKVDGEKSFNDFKAAIGGNRVNVEPINLKTTINESYEILQQLTPH